MILFTLFITFFKVGLFTFGGGYAMLPLIQQEVAAHGWMSTDDLINFVAVSESTPGPFGINISTYVGSVVSGVPGAFFATLGVVMPSFLIILLVARFYLAFKTNRTVEGIMSGLKPAVVGLIGASVLSVGSQVFFAQGYQAAVFLTPAFWISLFIFMTAVILHTRKIHPILIILLSALIGIIAGTVGIL